MTGMHETKTRSCTMSESMIRVREAGRRGARSHRVTFTWWYPGT